MSDNSPQEDLLHDMADLLKRFDKRGDLAPIEDRNEWDKLVSSHPQQERELIDELTRFADLWRYFQERKEKLGSEIVKAVSELPNLPVPERTARIKEINQKLMERIGDAGEGVRFRH